MLVISIHSPVVYTLTMRVLRGNVNPEQLLDIIKTVDEYARKTDTRRTAQGVE